MGRRGGGRNRSKARVQSSRTTYSTGRSKARVQSSRTTYSTGRSKASSSKSKAARTLQSNRRKGVSFERQLKKALKHSPGIRRSSVKSQVRTKNGRADIVARTTFGAKLVLEAKNYNKRPAAKSDVKQVKRYAKARDDNLVLVYRRNTKVTSAVGKYASNRGVSIWKW